MWVETFTGLRLTQFSGLLKVVRERGGNGTLRGRPWSLPPAGLLFGAASGVAFGLTDGPAAGSVAALLFAIWGSVGLTLHGLGHSSRDTAVVRPRLPIP